MRKQEPDKSLIGEDLTEDSTAGTRIAGVIPDQDATAEAASPGSKIEVKKMENFENLGESAVESSIKRARFAPLNTTLSKQGHNSMDLLMDVSLDLSVELGRTSIPVKDVLQLGPGSILELDKLAGEPVDIMVNGKLIAKGEVVVVDENFGIRVTEIASRTERLTGLA